MAVEVERARRRFTVEEFERMADAGILTCADRVELIRGEIVEMSPIGLRHAAFVANLTQLLVMRMAGRAVVRVQGPVVVAPDSRPQPDLALLRHRAVPYREAAATPGDVLLLIEVADSSLAYDRMVKRRLYAETGIAEYWVVDCAAESVEIHRAPGPDGYREVSPEVGSGLVSPAAFPDAALALSDIFA
jgi:Uma2 family endonuclease